MPKPFNFSGTVGVCITRGGPPIVVGVPEALPWAGVDQGDGTAAVLVQTTSGSSSSGGTSAQKGIPTAQYTVSAMAAAVQISQASPLSSRFSITVTNTGGNPIWVGPAGVTAGTGFPIFSGNTAAFPIGSPVPLYAYSTAGSTVATMEFQ
jgi:hypothetical protein